MTTRTVLPDRLATLDSLTLDEGAHDAFTEGACAMEAAAWLAGEHHSDRPACVSPVIGTYVRSLNDNWERKPRQQLKPYLPRIIGTAGDGQDEARSYLALDWLIRTYTPAWLDLAGLKQEAQALRDLRRIVDMVAAEAAGPVVREAQAKASAVRSAAESAAWSAAESAAWSAVRDAAEETLAPTVQTLQTSALDLLDRMIDPSAVTS